MRNHDDKRTHRAWRTRRAYRRNWAPPGRGVMPGIATQRTDRATDQATEGGALAGSAFRRHYRPELARMLAALYP
jgi:hypothetical protein